MKLSELFEKFNGDDLDIKGIAINSSEVKPGYLFVAIKGNKTDGHKYIQDAVERGAAAIVCENEFQFDKGVCTIKVDSTNRILPKLVKDFYRDPSSQMKIIGITGTNGKTTTSYILRNIFQAEGISTGILGTIDYIIGNRRIPAPLTTPDVLKVNQYLSQMIMEGCRACVMETSSHALMQGRVDGINFQAGIYTNIGRDHMDYHKTIENYICAKAKLFQKLGQDSWAVINTDDPYSANIIENTLAKVVGYGIGKMSKESVGFGIKARSISVAKSGMKFSISAPGFNRNFSVESKLIGYHNVYNILAAAGAALSFGISEQAIKEGIYITNEVPGRLENIDQGQPFTVFIDYAHTPDALESVLSTLKKIAKKRIITVFGCGGNRDKDKRPLMGRISGRMSDYTIITTDNPREEDPLQIIAEIERGFIEGNYKIISDRKEAIRMAFDIAQADDIVLIAGKGHENYQILKNTVIPFSDRSIAEELLKEYATVTC